MNNKPINLVFLDIDGVLNCCQTKERIDSYIGIEDKKVKLLKELVDKTDSKIILVSTWKAWWYADPSRKNRQDRSANYLDAILARHNLKIIDKTYEYNFRNRGEGILYYLDNLKRSGIEVNNYVILDDMMFDYEKLKLKNHLVKTTFRWGLRDNHIDKAIKILENKSNTVFNA